MKKVQTQKTLSRACGIFFSLPFALPLAGCYISTQASAFLAMQFSAHDTAKLLANDATDEETRQFLTLVNTIKEFGQGELGLARGKNFSTYVALDRDWVALIVHAAPEFSLEPYRWNYPVVGRLPYKGFFKREDAVKESEKLKKHGLDVLVRPVEAFSTLGFFKDPLYSFMRDYDEADLANLILHEETHATLFLKKHAGFNEEFASFTGDVGAFKYLEAARGGEAGEASRQKARIRAEDSAAFRQEMKTLAERLRPLYAMQEISPNEKRAQKETIIKDFQQEFAQNYDARFKTAAYKTFSERSANNAYISLFLLYGEHQNRFEEIYAGYNGDLRAFIQDIVRVTKKAKDPWLALEQLRQ
jgi:predicted aminopeptidase